jgi:hypothetical protein
MQGSGRGVSYHRLMAMIVFHLQVLVMFKRHQFVAFLIHSRYDTWPSQADRLLHN